jgi:Na+/glutamate symporter
MTSWEREIADYGCSGKLTEKLLKAVNFLAFKRAMAVDQPKLAFDPGREKRAMTMTFYLDTVTGTLMASRAVLGIALAGVVILIEALVLYRLKWALDPTQSAAETTQPTVAVYSPRRHFMACLRDSFLANLVSTAVGWFLAQYVFFFSFWSIPFWVTAFVITIIVETLMLWVLRRKSVRRSGIAALATNAASYFALVFLFGLIYWLGLAGEI